MPRDGLITRVMIRGAVDMNHEERVMNSNHAAEPGALKALTAHTFTHEVEHARELVLVDFYADWCPPCHVVRPILEGLASEYAGSVTIVKVDVDAEPALMARFQIRSLPTVLYFKDGAVVDTVVGAHPRRVFEGKIREQMGREELDAAL